MKAAASIVQAPRWTPPIFTEIAEPDYTGQFDLEAPWVRDGILWASDRRIIVQHFLAENERNHVSEYWAEPQRRTPDARKVFEACVDTMLFAEQRAWVELPTLHYPTKCGCHGMVADCIACEGKVYQLLSHKMPIEGPISFFALARYVALLRRHGITRVKASGHDRPVYFSSSNDDDHNANFCGFLMPCVEGQGSGVVAKL